MLLFVLGIVVGVVLGASGLKIVQELKTDLESAAADLKKDVDPTPVG